MENDLSTALCDSISGEATSLTTELLEVGLDSVLDDGILKEVPILSTAVSLYKIGNSLKERHYVKKLASFVATLNKGIVNEEKREYYRSKITDNPTQSGKELEYILLLIDRYIHSDKAKLLAKLYLAFLDGRIKWVTLSEYAEILDRFLPSDITALIEYNGSEIMLLPEQRLRLSALGLLEKTDDNSSFYVDDEGMLHHVHNVEKYLLTSFGNDLKNILLDY